MRLLLNDRFAPITSELGFLECDSETASNAFLCWQKDIQSRRGVHLERSVVKGDLQHVLMKLLPLTSVERRRYLFLSTKGGWTAYFDNGCQGGDPASTVSFLSEKIGCKGVRAVCVPHELDPNESEKSGRYGAVIWEVYSPIKTEFLNTLRSVCVAYDGGKWVFETTGVQQPMENIGKYKAKLVRDRFTSEMLNGYLSALGIDAFSDEFYLPQGEAILIEKQGPVAPNLKEFSLEMARG